MQLLITLDINDQKYNNYVLKQYKTYLDATEFERYFNISDHNRKKMFLISRGELKCKLGAMLGVMPQDVSFSYTDCGKPYIDGSNVHFSISHTQNLLAIVIASFEVGIDIEKIVDRDFKKISKRILNMSVTDRENFYKMWTAHEAIVKCEGNSSVLKRIGDNAIFGDYNIAYTKYQDCMIAIASRAYK